MQEKLSIFINLSIFEIILMSLKKNQVLNMYEDG